MNSKFSPENISDFEEDAQYGFEEEDFFDFMKDLEDEELLEDF